MSIDLQLKHPKYRPDIDGLRAIAVLAVILFHAYPGLLRGGFIGVDVFFVISGYLISTIIFKSLESGVFTFREFYARRIRRIFPALIVVFLATLFLGRWILSQVEFKLLGKHIAGGAGFLPNIVFWQESGYFDVGSRYKPLLHLWSLGIEEQFYIFWPLILCICWRKGVKALSVTFLLMVISFILNVTCIQNYRVATFYLPVTRCWELLSGGALAWMVYHKPEHIKAFTIKYRNVIAYSGFFIIVLGCFVLYKKLNFPGWWAIIPVLGTILVILAGAEAHLNKNILALMQNGWVKSYSFMSI